MPDNTAEQLGAELAGDQAPGDDPGPVPEDAEPGFMDLWAALAPGRAARGVYSIYKDDGGALIISYRADGADDDAHLTIPAGMIRVMSMAAEGKGPLGKLAAFAARRQVD